MYYVVNAFFTNRQGDRQVGRKQNPAFTDKQT